MDATAAFINALAALLNAIAWPIAIFGIVVLLRTQLVELMNRVEDLSLGDKSIKFRQAAISGIHEAVEQLIQQSETSPHAVKIIDESILELVEDDPRMAILTQWDRVQNAIRKLANKNGIEVDLRSITKTTNALQSNSLISKELSEALVQLHKSCRYARHVYEFNLPREAVIDYVKATDDAINSLKSAML